MYALQNYGKRQLKYVHTYFMYVCSYISNILLHFHQINELRMSKLFFNEPELIALIEGCLQVNSADRPSAKEAHKLLRTQ